MRYRFHSEQWLPYPVEEVFAFFANPENLPRLMPSWQDARIEQAIFAPPPPRPLSGGPGIHAAVAGPGSCVTLGFRPFPHSPFRLSWEAEISEFQWNHHFCDIQLRGPFVYWRHCHTVVSEVGFDLAANAVAGTILRDEVEYEVPFGTLGRFAHRLFLSRQLGRTFAYRQARTLTLLAPAAHHR